MPLDPNILRADFPILATKVHGKPLVYFDNAATTQKPQIVIDALVKYYTEMNANVHRGLHHLAEVATEAIESAREKTRAFINAPSVMGIVFTRNATEAINLVAQSYGRTHLKPGDEILLTQMEHHSNLVPWQLVAKTTGASLRFVPIMDNGLLDLTAFEQLLTPKTKIFAFTMMSNVLGTINPVKDLTAKAHAVGAVVCVDAAQGAAHLPVDVQALNCDFLALSSHKMCGPTGVGVLYGKETLLNAMPPFLGGGEMIRHVEWETATWNDLPYKFEAGTPNIADTIAFGTALDYLRGIGMANIREHEKALTVYAFEVLSAHRDCTIYGPHPTMPASVVSSRTCGVEGGAPTAWPAGGATQAPVITQRGGVISFNVGDIHPHDLGQALDFEGVAIRAGHHCAQPLMGRLGVVATARARFYLYNTKEEIDVLSAALEKTRRFFHQKIARK
ncbi:MAG: cysteine desulfurase [Deltaproteobacteria bacterium]|nr:cysteine desulfurase [Deltaproteobacteria bacterium]